MATDFSYTLLREWFKAEEERDRPELKGLAPHQKLLLLSDGSMTLDLELLSGSRVEIELKHKGIKKLSGEDASYLCEPTGTEAMEREVWLTVNKKRLVYAYSLIPLNCIKYDLKQELEKYSGEPLGRVLSSRKIFFEKEKLEVSIVRCETASRDLKIPQDTAMIARRYILFNKEDEGSWVIKASVTEVFSPEIIASPIIKGGL
ncbi:MAG: chorismate lyase [Deltaproteobacteria bacterium]|nr:chorismate lyase [Deltaproteobacteria bacterium]